MVAGARSALFLPFKDLRLIVVDEEHEAAYKQEEGVIYHARDMAVVRARQEQCAVVLASATPSIETRENAEQGRYGHAPAAGALRRPRTADLAADRSAQARAAARQMDVAAAASRRSGAICPQASSRCCFSIGAAMRR